MATQATDIVGGVRARELSGDVVGGAIVALLGLVHLFGLQFGGGLGFFLLLVVWPFLGGAIAARVERGRPTGRDWQTTSAVSGALGAVVTAVLVFLTGVAGVWSGFITTAFGSAFWAVVFAVLVLFTIAWTVFAYAGGFAESRIATTTE